jgi:2-succinyl-6-hydroxy-2,4-cyclohexadiene-1-carboxylate synthase
MVALHGFSMTGEQFSPTAEPLGYTIIAPDLPGHGLSRTQSCDVDSVLANIESVLASPGGPRPLLGYSQGGRMALLAAVESPADMSSLVLISATAGFRDIRQRRDRADQDAELAGRIQAIGLDAFVDSWTTAGITSIDHLSAEHREWDRIVRSANTSGGLSAALRGYGQGAQPSIWDELATLDVAVLLIVGGEDNKYRTVNEEMTDLISGAELRIIAGARHNPMADKPEETYEVVSEFLQRNR